MDILLPLFHPPFLLLSHHLVPDINLNSPNKGLVVEHSDNLSDVPVEGAVGNSANPLPPSLTEEEAEELHTELTKVTPGVYTVVSGSQRDSQSTEDSFHLILQ